MVGNEDPSNAELGRRLSDITGMLSGHIGRAEYTAELRAIEHRFTDLTRDLEDARSQHAADMRMLGERLTAEIGRIERRVTTEVTTVSERITRDADKAEANRHSWRNAIWVGVLPAVAVVLEWIFEILSHGGKP